LAGGQDSPIGKALVKSATNISYLPESESMKHILQLADQVSQQPGTFLLTGELETSKEIVARFIHRCSQHREKAFVTVSYAAITDILLESEFFGHEKGAFACATKRRRTLAEIERTTIIETLSRNKGDRRTTSQELRISLRTLKYRLKEYDNGG